MVTPVGIGWVKKSEQPTEYKTTLDHLVDMSKPFEG